MGADGPDARPEVATVTISGIAAGGDGVGRLPDGCTVFVPRTAPQDRATVMVTQRRRRWARARVVTVDSAGPDRAEPRCVHYMRDDCGGCQLQHLTLAAQQRAKERIVGDALRRIGNLDVRDPVLVPSPAPWRYRTKITLGASRPGGPLGLRSYLDPTVVFEPEDCLITGASIMRLWSSIRRHRTLLPADVESIMIRAAKEDEHHVVVKATAPFMAGDLAAAVGNPAVCYWNWHGSTGVLRQVAGPVTESAPLLFDQSNRDLAEEIRRQAVDWLHPVGGRCVWDLYGGIGATAHLLATAGADVQSVDSDPVAHRPALHPAEHAAHPIRFVTDRVERAVASLPEPDAVVLNPPRSGIGHEVAAWLDAWAVRHEGCRAAYISCDPATLARDLRRMPRLPLREVKAFDLFPQTSHVEALALLGGL